VTRLELGGPSGQPRDRIFISSGSIVKGYNRRGKQFLDFNTNTTEPVRSLYDAILLFDFIFFVTNSLTALICVGLE